MKNGGPEGSMPTNSGLPSPVPPDEVQALFGEPPLLRGEDVGLYNELMGQFAKLVEPKDMIEWWWVKDLTDHSWEIRRLRRFKVLFVEVGRDQLFENIQMSMLPMDGRRMRRLRLPNMCRRLYPIAKRTWPAC